MSNKAQPLQVPFLNALRADSIPVSIFLVNALKMSGQIVSFDQYALVLRHSKGDKMVYKHAIATVVADRRPTFNIKDEPEDGAKDDIQSTFLSVLKTSGQEVSIYLISGIRLVGKISYFDQFCILLESAQSIQMVYKHAVSTVVGLK